MPHFISVPNKQANNTECRFYEVPSNQTNKQTSNATLYNSSDQTNKKYVTHTPHFVTVPTNQTNKQTTVYFIKCRPDKHTMPHFITVSTDQTNIMCKATFYKFRPNYATFYNSSDQINKQHSTPHLT